MIKIKNSKQIFDFFPGVWRINRKVISKFYHENMYAKGYATFEIAKKNNNILFYSEKVAIYNPILNVSNIATQEYKYIFDLNNLFFYKYLSDSNFFYIINILDDRIGGEYVCMNDKYVSSYMFSDNSFIITYLVNGKSKCYNITTEYTKTNIRI